MGKDKIKVLNLIWSMKAGGAQQVVLNYLKYFQNDPDIDFRLCVYTAQTNSKYDREIKEKGYSVTYLNNPMSPIHIPYIKRWFQISVSKFAWEQAICEFNPDIVHVHISELLCQTLDPICKCEVPIRFDTLHSNPYRNTGFKKKIIMKAFQEKHFIPICVTNEQVNMAKDWYGISRYEVVHNGVDIDKIQKQIVSRKEAREKLGLQQEEFIVLGVGRLNPIKRFDLLIKAFAIMLKKQPNAELLIAGNGKEQKKLVKLVDKMDIADKVIFWGNIDTVTEIYCAADVVAITSKSESSSLVAIEAQACGTRCVMSDGVPSESIISSCSRRMDANATLIDWADALLDNDYRGKPICSALDYEVHVTSDNMKKIYLKYYKEYEREK